MSIPKSYKLSIPLKVQMPRVDRPARLPLPEIALTVLEKHPYAIPPLIKLDQYLDPYTNLYMAICGYCKPKLISPWSCDYDAPASLNDFRYSKILIERKIYVIDHWLQFHAWTGVCKTCNHIIYTYDRD